MFWNSGNCIVGVVGVTITGPLDRHPYMTPLNLLILHTVNITVSTLQFINFYRVKVLSALGLFCSN